MGDWQETAAMYEQIFTKPKMSEKLLNKPPFRFLHDMYTATMGKTGFGQGLFEGEELNSKSFEDKDSKLAFLVKLITLTEMVVGEKIDIKPSLVLAGQNAEKTNAWLQQMFRAATSGVDTTPHVQQILGIGGEEEGEGEEDMGGAEDQAQAEAEAQAQAQAEEEARQQAAAEKAEKKRRHEEKKMKQQQKEQEEFDRQQRDAEDQERQMQQQQQMEQEEMMKQQQMAQQQQQQRHVIRDDEQEEEEEDRGAPQREEIEPAGYEGRGGALVEEAKRMMQEDEGDEAPKEAENNGPKIKMNRIGKKKKGAAAGSTATKKATGRADEPDSFTAPTGGFKEEDIEFMKKAIQVLCQSTNPLGKSIDFVTDDIESMNKEYEHWRKESQACQRDLEEQQKITEEVVQPLQDQQAELEERIREQQAKVNSIRSSIMRNDMTVQNLLQSVISSR